MKVSLVPNHGVAVADLASYAARTCYQAEEPELGNRIDVAGRLFDTGHHTTLAHSHFTFHIEEIPVSAITLGLHLCSPFYNSSQRSGRFCGKMFENPDLAWVRFHIETYWPEVEKTLVDSIVELFADASRIYRENLPAAVVEAATALRTERPHAREEYISQNAPKIAQEQLRVLLPSIVPTGITFTVNLSALAAMYRSAFAPDLRALLSDMASLVKPHIGDDHLADRIFSVPGAKDWNMPFCEINDPIGLWKNPLAWDVHVEGDFSPPAKEDTHPSDLLHFRPEFMGNNLGFVSYNAEISLATMGQDQRHRTIHRGSPSWTGNAYVPPIVDGIGLSGSVKEICERWRLLYAEIPGTLFDRIAPYGAMVVYRKHAPLNALCHEMGKRICFSSQQEIFCLALSLESEIGTKNGMGRIFRAPCEVDGKCSEGVRYCGRKIDDSPRMRCRV